MNLQQLVTFATDGRDQCDPDLNIELQFEIKLSPELRGDPYPLEVASVDYTTKVILLY
jgi:hypothetical protein